MIGEHSIKDFANGKRHNIEIIPLLNPETPLDVTVKLSSARKNKHDLRLVGIYHEGVWPFYITNVFQKLFTKPARMSLAMHGDEWPGVWGFPPIQ